MRILYICSRESDYLQDLTYAGLAGLLGKDSVLDFPFHGPYHRLKKAFWSRPLAYPRNLGFLPGGPTLDGKRDFSWLEKELGRNGFDLVVLGSAKPDALETLGRLFEHVRAPWIFVDGGDRPEIGGDFLRTGGPACAALFRSLCARRKPALVFKRELAPGAREENVFPLSFSLRSDLVPALDPGSKKEYQVLFRAVESSQTRKEAFRLLRGRYDCDANGSIPGQTFRKYDLRGESYFEALNRSRISLSFRGEGFDTLRYWEIPACGSLLVSEKPTIVIPEDFADRRQAAFCKNDLSDLTEILDYYLAHEREAQEIARAGQAHLLQHHTHLRRAEYFLNILESRLGLKVR